MFANLQPLGFLAAAKSQDTELLIEQTEQLVAALGPDRSDFKSAKEALRVAKSLYAAHDYAKAFAQAKRAVALAASLNDRFNAYLAAWKTLQECMGELQGLGFPTQTMEAALGAADKEVVRMVDEEGTVVPNYLGATVMLKRATEDAHTLVVRAREVSHEIFLATLAVEALSESRSTRTPGWLAVRLDRMVEQATGELALGNVSAASQIAWKARARAEDALAGAARTWELLDMSAAILDGLGAEGQVAVDLAEQIGSARAALEQGFLDLTTASTVAHRLSDEVASFARHYPRARRALERAECVYSRLHREGFSSRDIDGALSEARRSLDAGDWCGVTENIGRASRRLVQLRREQYALGRTIVELEERVALLEGFHLPLMPDVQELMSRAKEEVCCGRLSAANEDLLMAKALLMRVTRAGSSPSQGPMGAPTPS